MSLTIKDAANLERQLDQLWGAEYFKSVQRAINAGIWGHLPGRVAAQLMASIKVGRCLLGRQGFMDYSGNYVPSRDEAQDGTMGSRGFVAAKHGEEWAARMEAVE